MSDTPRTDAAKIPASAIRLPMRLDGTCDWTACFVTAEEMAKIERELKEARAALERIYHFPVHSEPAGGALAMQDIAYDALKAKEKAPR